MYHGVLSLEQPKEAEIVGIVDDVTLRAISETQEEVAMLSTEANGLVEYWMEGVKLKNPSQNEGATSYQLQSTQSEGEQCAYKNYATYVQEAVRGVF